MKNFERTFLVGRLCARFCGLIVLSLTFCGLVNAQCPNPNQAPGMPGDCWPVSNGSILNPPSPPVVDANGDGIDDSRGIPKQAIPQIVR